MRIAFAEFVLDTAGRQLRRGATEVHLEPKALDLLELLLRRRPDAVSRIEIQRTLWPDTFVSESSLTGLVAQVRKALGDSPGSERFLRTVHRFGYAFSGEAAAGEGEERAPRARLVWEDASFPLSPGEHLLGRGEEASVRIDAPDVSRRHARLLVTEGGATLEDLGSKNGTLVGEMRIEGPAPLQDGDRIRLGGQLLVFRRDGPATPTRTAGPPLRAAPSPPAGRAGHGGRA
jgi:DNA-binding winged helix-turn-helix (wHTH) protein